MTKYTYEDINTFEISATGYILCPVGDYSDIKYLQKDKLSFGKGTKFGSGTLFGNNCVFDEYCVFGDGCVFGSNSFFKNNCTFGECCIFNPHSVFGSGCVFGKYCNFYYMCKFKDCCRFDCFCKFGNECEFLHNCSFSHDSKFGTKCTFGIGCEFEGYMIRSNRRIECAISINDNIEFGSKCEFGKRPVVETEHTDRSKIKICRRGKCNKNKENGMELFNMKLRVVDEGVNGMVVYIEDSEDGNKFKVFMSKHISPKEAARIAFSDLYGQC